MPRTKTAKPVKTSSTAPKKAKKPAAPKKVVASAPVQVESTPAPLSEPPSVPPSVPDAASKTVVGLQDDFTAYLAKIQQAVSLLGTLRTEFRALERRALRELRAAEKITLKRKRKTGNRSPSGFVKPALISDELASFLSKPSGTEMARTEVTREINAYIREHNLQDKENGRKINADAKLSTLLSLSKEDELTYFNLQKYMSRHFPKVKKEEASSA